MLSGFKLQLGALSVFYVKYVILSVSMRFNVKNRTYGYIKTYALSFSKESNKYCMGCKSKLLGGEAALWGISTSANDGNVPGILDSRAEMSAHVQKGSLMVDILGH